MLSVLKDRQSDGEKMKELHTSIKARNQRRKKRRRKDLHIRRSLLKSGQTDEKKGILAQRSCLLVDNQMKRKRKEKICTAASSAPSPRPIWSLQNPLNENKGWPLWRYETVFHENSDGKHIESVFHLCPFVHP